MGNATVTCADLTLRVYPQRSARGNWHVVEGFAAMETPQVNGVRRLAQSFASTPLQRSTSILMTSHKLCLTNQ